MFISEAYKRKFPQEGSFPGFETFFGCVYGYPGVGVGENGFEISVLEQIFQDGTFVPDYPANTVYHGREMTFREHMNVPKNGGVDENGRLPISVISDDRGWVNTVIHAFVEAAQEAGCVPGKVAEDPDGIIR